MEAALVKAGVLFWFWSRCAYVHTGYFCKKMSWLSDAHLRRGKLASGSKQVCAGDLQAKLLGSARNFQYSQCLPDVGGGRQQPVGEDVFLFFWGDFTLPSALCFDDFGVGGFVFIFCLSQYVRKYYFWAIEVGTRQKGEMLEGRGPASS